MSEIIHRFSGEHIALSNFAECPTMFEDVLYETSEHAYQAAKSLDPEYRAIIAKCPTPGAAKKLARQLLSSPRGAYVDGVLRKFDQRADWMQANLGIMYEIVLDKFQRNRWARDVLFATGDAELVEGNYWGDTFWGVCRGVGENHLGKILMRLRKRLRKQYADNDQTPARKRAKR